MNVLTRRNFVKSAAMASTLPLLGRGAFADEPTCEGDGVAALDRDPVAHAFVQADGSPFEDIDRGQDLEGALVLTC